MEPNDDKTSTHVVLTKGTMVSHYRIISKIGAGGMGEVYLAEDTQLDRKVALKFLPPHLCQDEDCRKRFKREAQAAAKLSHPNIIHVYEVSEYQGRPFFAMEHVEGRSLRDVRSEEFDIDRIIGIAIQLCDGLQSAHAAGVIHRDIKPSNIIIDSAGRPKLLDFGLATVKGGEHLTKTGSTLGTVGYMSPEQIEGKATDARSDLFSLGVVLYELIANKSPFRRDDDTATFKAIIHDTPEPLARYKSDVPDDLQRNITKLLEKDPSLRYQSAAGVIPDLKKLSSAFSSASVTDARYSWWNRYVVPSAVVVLLAVVGLLLLQPWRQAPVTDDVPMIAVLPFENLGPPEDEYFADGMTEEITSRLAGIQGLGVISRTSAINYKNADKQLSEIGKELGVTYILEGTVRWSRGGEQSRVRITPQLIRVSDDRHLWADNYERELLEVFEVQADIAMQIVEQLGVTLLEKDRLTLGTRPTENAEAYKFYLRGVDLIKRIELRPQPLLEAVRMFDSAITLDPGFAMAYAYRSASKSICCFQMIGDVSSFAVQAHQDAETALSLNPDLAHAHLALGVYYSFVRRDYTRAMEEFSKAKTGLYNNPTLYMGIGLVQMRQGRFDEAVDNFQRAADLDPLDPARHRMLSLGFSYTQQYEQAIWAIDRAIWLDNTRPDFYADKILLYASRYGDLEKMRQVVDDARESVDPMAIAMALWWNFDVFDITVDSQLSYFARAPEGSVAPHQYYGNMARIYTSLDRPEMAASYAESTRVTLETMIEQLPNEADLYAMLSFALANLGQYDAAIDAAQKGKELMSVDDCHW
jgi:serine/threonine protein kinase